MSPICIMFSKPHQYRQLSRTLLTEAFISKQRALNPHHGTPCAANARFMTATTTATSSKKTRPTNGTWAPVRCPIGGPPVAHARITVRFAHLTAPVLASAPAPERKDAMKRVQPFIMPDIGEGISEVVVREWLVQVGDQVSEFDGLCEVESDKATATISSRFNGTIKALHYEVGASAFVGKPLVDIEVELEAGSPQSTAAAADAETPAIPKPPSSPPVPAARAPNAAGVGAETRPATALPSVRRLAGELGVDLAQVPATGRHGQVLKEDLLAFARQSNEGPSPVAAAAAASRLEAPEPALVRRPLSGVQRVMFRTMSESLKIPHFSHSDEVDVTELKALLDRHKAFSAAAAAAAKDQRPTVSQFAFLVKMVSLALDDFPELNASIEAGDDQQTGPSLVVKRDHNIGVAIDTGPNGLIVPNIKQVQRLSARQVGRELRRLRELAYAGKLGLGELNGGTISLSNIGAVGGVFGVPIIVAPEIVIGAIGRARPLARYDAQGALRCRQIMQIVWSADHRALDGATLARFSNRLKAYLEDPSAVALELA